MRDAAARQLEIFSPSRPQKYMTPSLKIEAPSRPSKSSERGAAYTKGSPFRRESWRRILVALSNLPEGKYLSRKEIAARTDIEVTSLCGRLSELTNLKFKIAGTEDCVCLDMQKDVCVSKTGIEVNGYRLSHAARGLFEERR